jgi:ParB-like nuclease domain
VRALWQQLAWIARVHESQPSDKGHEGQRWNNPPCYCQTTAITLFAEASEEAFMKPAHDLVIEYFKLAELQSQRRNARTHTKKQIRQIADSIRTFGFTNPILIDDEKITLAGHGRIEAAQSLGMTMFRACVCPT